MSSTLGETAIRSLINFIVLVGFTLILPFFCAAAWGWGSADEKRLMKVAGCVLSPFCDFWYIILSNLVLRRRSSYLVQFVIFVLGYSGVFFLLKSGMVRFLSEPQRELAPAALYELFERHSQCVVDPSGKCPLRVFTQQMCWEINEFFNGEENENTRRRRRNLP